MKHNTGWNCFLKQDVLKKINTKKYKMNVVLFAEC